MNRIVLACSIFMVLVGLVGCSSNSNHTKETEHNQTIETKSVIEKTEYFEVFQTSDHLTYCNFYDKKGILIKQEGPMTKIPTVCFVDDNLIKFSLQAGTGTATNWGYYFDVEQEKFSEVFSSIFDEQNTRVVYVTTNEVVVRDIFDINQYYKTISNFSKDFPPVANPFTDIHFSEDGNSLFVTYFTGNNYEETTETFVLTD